MFRLAWADFSAFRLPLDLRWPQTEVGLRLRLTRPDGTSGADVEILCFLDDHSRYALSVTCHQPVTGPVVVAVFRQAVADQGIPASVLSDNGMVFTTRFAGGRAGRDTLNGFSALLRDLGVTQKHSKPNHPTTCGKVCEDFAMALHRVGLTLAKV
jgi:transposase InsO family protein